MLKPPVCLTSFNHYRPRQKQAIALLKLQPRTKTELAELMGVKKGNLNKLLETLISKGAIVPTASGKYEIYSKKP